MGLFVVAGLFVAIAVWSSLRVRTAGYRGGAGGPPAPARQHAFAADALTVTGGARIGRMNATWPFGSMRVDRDWALISAPVVGRAWIERQHTTGVRVVWGPMGTGVLFHSADDRYSGVVFWTFSAATVTRALREQGWPVAD